MPTRFHWEVTDICLLGTILNTIQQSFPDQKIVMINFGEGEENDVDVMGLSLERSLLQIRRYCPQLKWKIFFGDSLTVAIWSAHREQNFFVFNRMGRWASVDTCIAAIIRLIGLPDDVFLPH